MSERARQDLVGVELDGEVVTVVAGEPEPAAVDDERALQLQLAGSPIVSAGGGWTALCRYDDGDVARWVPRRVSADDGEVGWVADHLAATLIVERAPGGATTAIFAWGEVSVRKQGASLAEAVARAALAAVERGAPRREATGADER